VLKISAVLKLGEGAKDLISAPLSISGPCNYSQILIFLLLTQLI